MPPPRGPIIIDRVSQRANSLGRSYRITGNRAEYDQSIGSNGFQVYIYWDKNGKQLYVGVSGGMQRIPANESGWSLVEFPNPNPRAPNSWFDRFLADHLATFWAPEAKTVEVYSGLDQLDALALEEYRIPYSPLGANLEPGQYSPIAARFDLPSFETVGGRVLKRPHVRFDIDVLLPLRPSPVR
jgi:hypothetical protein